MAKKTETPPNTLATLIKIQNELCGPGTLFTGLDLKRDPPRLPSGIFAVDYATGGGLPLWGTTCAWGPKNGGKTNLCLNAVRMCHSICWNCFRVLEFCKCSKSKRLPMRAFWGDVEGTLDRDWATSIGVKPDKYVIALADYGEQYANIAESALRADDCGLVVVDSLAAMTPAAEMEASAESDFIALQTRMITRMVRKLKQRLIRERKRGHPCTVLFVNQLRVKIGQMFGDPETMSGGNALQHEFSLLLRCVKKSMKKDGGDAKFFDAGRKKELGARFSFAIRKAKVQTLAGVGEYVRVLEDFNDGNIDLHKGHIEDFTSVLTYAKEYGLIRKIGKKWKYFSYEAKKLDDIKRLWRLKWPEYMRVQMEIVRLAKERVAPKNAE